MELTLKVQGAEAGDESRNLLAWLRADEIPGLRVSIDYAPAAPDKMGTLDDALRLVVDPASVAAVASAIATWLTTRRRAVEIYLKHGDRELKLSAGSPNDARKFLGELEGLLAPQEIVSEPGDAPPGKPAAELK